MTPDRLVALVMGLWLFWCLYLALQWYLQEKAEYTFEESMRDRASRGEL